MSVRSALASAFRSVATLAVCLLATTPAAAQSVLRDAETEALFRDMASPLVRAAGLDPKNVDIVLVNDSSINAFVAGGQAVYIHSGLINEASSALEVQGVIAHELGHVVGGHAIDDRGAKMAGNISILSLLLGAAAAAAGGGAAAMGVFMAGQQAAMGKFLAYTRGEEEAADAAGASFLSKAGMSGRGSLEFFHKLLVMENRYGMTHSDEASFYSTHPLTDERIAYLEDVYKKDPAWNAPSDPALEERFQRVKAKLYGYLAEPPSTFQAFPEYMNNVPALYARAYAYHKEGFLDKATTEADKLLALAPRDPYFLELKGQILLEAGKPAEALGPLRQATALTGNQPLIATTFGHALIAQDDLVNSRDHLDEAQKVLKAAVARDRENPFAWYVLGITYAKSGDLPRARLASAEQASLSGNWGGAMVNAEAAKNGLAAGSPDAIRAEDIALEAKSYLAKSKKR
ncbi:MULTISPECIES: M48 family metalloprotease [unclassified Novosphingobium]|uniref:M48 family metalloprotease n=1 Tax=unclassified Novosphingobium TaxID=2644732 RepID=UPI00086E0A2B|nr:MULTISPECIES: M48 family metalloprotease [unclassified Novosphingobium]MBN9142783.1 M48 family metalloprotease [Novosphingobium sp.]MDR6705868.1 putative Zn-dependent protease [Novosphingobium sp. 1748]ODU85047.1 MAG: peptidase M48 [Novosphingobium sp. SCN 63-17]OJX89176.1 MAG: peptidase M48 [Novosphingobium sp. 63-713]